MRTALLTLLILTGCTHQPPATQPAATQPATLSAHPVAALWHAVGYPPVGYNGPWQTLIVGVWSDGTIVWSDNRKTGGPPYLSATISAERVSKFLVDLSTAGFFDETYENYYPPDASHTVLAAESGERRKRLSTWMDLVRPSTANSYAPRPHEAHFEKVWVPSRKLIEQLIPTSGQPAPAVDDGIFRLGRTPKK